MSEHVRSERRGAVAWVTFDRPEARNAFTTEMYTELTRLCDAIEAARARHSAALSVALDEALLQVPRLLRGPVKRIVLR